MRTVFAYLERALKSLIDFVEAGVVLALLVIAVGLALPAATCYRLLRAHRGSVPRVPPESG